jgi:hypothetical protein
LWARRFFYAMPSDPEIEAHRQWLDALVKDTDATEAKAAAARHRVQAARLLMEEEQAAAADLERKAAAAKGWYRLLPRHRLRPTWSTMLPTTRHLSPTSTFRQRQYQMFANW